MLVTLKGLFTPQTIAEALTVLPDIQTTVLDTAFPDRPTHPFPTVGKSEVTEIAGTIPLVDRTGQPYNIGNDEVVFETFEPCPVKPSINVTAAELNNLKMILSDKAAVQTWIQAKTDRLRRLVRETTEAMASVVLYTGKLSWPFRDNGGNIRTFEINYGAPLSYTPSEKLTFASKPSALFKILTDMGTAIRQAGIGGNVTFHCGAAVFAVLMDMVDGRMGTAATTGGMRMELSRDKQNTIMLGGYEIMLMNETYKDPRNNQFVDKINPKALVGFATDAKGKVWYCAIDSISANNAATPFHIVTEPIRGDVGVELIAQSKPLPARNSKGTCIAIVVD